MAEVIYCHQCAQNNASLRKFCLRCNSALFLQSEDSKSDRVCQTCHHSNSVFARYCVQCSSPLVANPSGVPDSRLPIAFRNVDAEGQVNCPACGHDVPNLVSDYVAALKSENRSKEIRDNAGFVYGTVGTRIKLESGLLEPKAGFPTGVLQALFTGALGCVLTLLVLAIFALLIPQLASVSVIVRFGIAALLSFFIAYQIYRFLLQPYLKRLEAARARWRRAHICLRCDAVFIPQEAVYTSPAYLDRLTWNVPVRN